MTKLYYVDEQKLVRMSDVIEMLEVFIVSAIDAAHTIDAEDIDEYHEELQDLSQTALVRLADKEVKP